MKDCLLGKAIYGWEIWKENLTLREPSKEPINSSSLVYNWDNIDSVPLLRPNVSFLFWFRQLSMLTLLSGFHQKWKSLLMSLFLVEMVIKDLISGMPLWLSLRVGKFLCTFWEEIKFHADLRVSTRLVLLHKRQGTYR